MTFRNNHYILRPCARRGISDFNPQWKSAAIFHKVSKATETFSPDLHITYYIRNHCLLKGASILTRSFLHTAKNSVFVLVTSSTTSSIIIFVIIILLHLDISIKLHLVSGIAFCLARMLAWSEGRAGEVVALAQVLGRDQRHRRRILESDGDGPGCTGGTKGA